MLLHSELQYEIAITTATTFLQISNVIAEHVFAKIAERFLQIAEHVFSKNRRISFLQIAKWFSPNL